jgi:hypothetical protein
MNGWARQAVVSIAPEVGLGERGIYKKSEAWRSVKGSGYARPGEPWSAIVGLASILSHPATWLSASVPSRVRCDRAGHPERGRPPPTSFHGLTLPPSRFGPSKASHSSFPTPPTLDAVRPWAVEAVKTLPLDPRALRYWHEHQKTIKQNQCLVHCQPDKLSMFAEPVIRGIDENGCVV